MCVFVCVCVLKRVPSSLAVYQMPDSTKDLSTMTEYPLTYAMTLVGAMFVLGTEQVSFLVA